MPQYTICLPVRRDPDRAFLNARRICFPIYLDVEVPHLPPGDPFGHLKALGTIAQLAGSLSDATPMRQELVDVAQRALEAAVAGLDEDAELVDSEAQAN